MNDKIFIRLIMTAFLLAQMVTGLIGCSNQRSVSTLPGAHPDKWLDIEAPEFHGAIALVKGLQSCAECHGKDWSGGKVEVSCIDCHKDLDICNDCHGGLSDSSSAPPFGLQGEISDTSLAVGAHAVHLRGDSISDGINCENCHNVPLFLLDSLHFDIPVEGRHLVDSIAEIVWHGIADGRQAKWNRTDRTCTGTYCHGDFPGGNDTNAPVWTAENQAACGSCHDVGDNPVNLQWEHEFHIDFAGLNCGDCHAEVIDTLLNIVGRDLHINGVIDTLAADTSVCNVCHGTGVGSCTMCHGGLDNETGAPPLGIDGETTSDQLAVGAHTTHVQDGINVHAFDCVECHIKPASAVDPGHLDADSIAEITWGGIAEAAGAAWDRNSAVCTNTYCHGNFAGGNISNTPVWTAENQTECGSCHDIGDNPVNLQWEHEFHIETAGLGCRDCHATVIDSLLNIIDIDLHVNGTADTLTRDTTLCNICHSSEPSVCLTCHGGLDNLTGAPPSGLRGETSAGELAVGAHTTHVEGSYVSDPFECNNCHMVPSMFTDPGHYDPDSVAELTWSSLAGDQAVWNRTTRICTDIYCHGNFSGGYTTNAPDWTGPSQAMCGSCHDQGDNPQDLGGEHEEHVVDKGLECRECHVTVVDTWLNIIGKDLHVDGNFDVNFLSGQGDFSNGTCSNLDDGCHGTEQWY